MLVIPILGSERKKFPVITLLLVLVNCLIFFFVQSGDNEATLKAYTYYEKSGLSDIELSAYRHFLKAQDKEIIFQEETLVNSPKARRKLMIQMLQNEEFQEQLRDRKIIREDNPAYSEWKSKRLGFEARLEQVISSKYGYAPAKKIYMTLLTYMFLHGSFMHLLGNMIFLWFVGSFLETGAGKGIFLVTYLVGGVCAGLLFGLFNAQSHTPLVGASGAIAGLMGAYGIVFGGARIKVFYSLGFYFDYARLPAWLLFPFWLLKEVYQLNADTHSNVAYMAHIGGLLAGALFGGAHRFFRGSTEPEILHDKDDEKKAIEQLLDAGLKKIAEFDFTNARKDIEKALEMQPGNRIALINLFHIDKCSPQSDLFHQTATTLLRDLGKEKSSGHDLLTFFEEYRKVSGSPRLSVDMYATIVHAYLEEKRTTESEQILSMLIKQAPDHDKIPGCLFRLAKTYHARKDPRNCKKCVAILTQKYSDSFEAKNAREMLAEGN